MFRRLSEPLPLSEASLLAMRPALNAPVLNVGFLPVGPARAAIVAFGEEWGGIGLALGIRSNETGQVAVFRNQESIEPDVPVPTALEPILAEAERMGFLFDEDMVASSPDTGGRTQAMELWGRLMGELDLPPSPRAAPAEPAARESIRLSESRLAPDGLSEKPAPAAAEADELVLDDRVPELDLGVEGVVVAAAPDISQPTQPLTDSAPPPADAAAGASDDGTESVLPRRAQGGDRLPEQSPATPAADALPPQTAPGQKLSKFRHVDEAVEADNETTGEITSGNQLGRIPLVRVRRGRESTKRASTLARLLASF